ncbi:MAG: hypothetical protein V7L23_24250 [Nostoc sp.]
MLSGESHFFTQDWERAKRPATANGKEELFCPMPNAQCPMPHAPCPI